MSDFLFFAVCGLFGLLALIVLIELGVISRPSKRTRVVPRRFEKWIAEFPSGVYRRIEWRELFNGQWHWKFKGHPHSIALTPFVDIKPVSVTPDGGKMLFKVLVEFDGFKSYAQPVYDSINLGQDLSQKQFYETKKQERIESEEVEDELSAYRSASKSVSDGMDEEYTENTYSLEKKMLEKLLEEKKKPKQSK